MVKKERYKKGANREEPDPYIQLTPNLKMCAYMHGGVIY